MKLTTAKGNIIFQRRTKNQHIRLQADEQLTFVFLLDENAPESLEYTFSLDGARAHVEVIGFETKSSGTASVRLRIIHNAAQTVSRTYVKSVLTGSTHTEFDGLIDIQKSAHGADAAFLHRTLLLSSEAQGIAKPALEIQADDVAASHAATVGTLDAEDIFYLGSRGLNTSEAKGLVIKGFVSEYLKRIKETQTRRACTALLQKKISNIMTA